MLAASPSTWNLGRKMTLGARTQPEHRSSDRKTGPMRIPTAVSACVAFGILGLGGCGDSRPAPPRDLVALADSVAAATNLTCRRISSRRNGVVRKGDEICSAATLRRPTWQGLLVVRRDQSQRPLLIEEVWKFVDSLEWAARRDSLREWAASRFAAGVPCPADSMLRRIRSLEARHWRLYGYSVTLTSWRAEGAYPYVAKWEATTGTPGPCLAVPEPRRTAISP